MYELLLIGVGKPLFIEAIIQAQLSGEMAGQAWSWVSILSVFTKIKGCFLPISRQTQ
jgi:hypothetical protein